MLNFMLYSFVSFIRYLCCKAASCPLLINKYSITITLIRRTLQNVVFNSVVKAFVVQITICVLLIEITFGLCTRDSTDCS